MRYQEYVVRRVLMLIPVFFGITILIFCISRVLPGDPARMVMGDLGATEEQIQIFRHEYGLDLPLHVQYLNFLIDMFHGKLGRSFRTYRDISLELWEKFPATLELVSLSTIFAMIIGIPLGILAALKKDKWQDHVSRLSSLVLISSPRFWVAILLQIIFAGLIFHILPAAGRHTPSISRPPSITNFMTIDYLLAGNFNGFIDAVKHLILPIICLSIGNIAVLTRIVRASIYEELSKDYTIALRARGLSENLINYKYMLKNALNAALTVTGISFGRALGGSFIIESIFAWPGLGSFMVESIYMKDLNAIVAVATITGFLFCIVNFIVDLLYAYLDPRIKFGE